MVHVRAWKRERERKMNHLIFGAVFWVTGESGGTDGRLALAGTWPPAAGRNQRTLLLVWMLDRNSAHTHTKKYITRPGKHHKPVWKHASYEMIQWSPFKCIEQGIYGWIGQVGGQI